MRWARCGVAAGVAAVALASAAPASAEVRRAPLGSTLFVSGQTGSRAGAARSVGLVVVRARWNHGAWTTLTSTRTDARGRYRVAIHLIRRGLLNLRITPPDGTVRTFTLRVV